MFHMATSTRRVSLARQVRMGTTVQVLFGQCSECWVNVVLISKPIVEQTRLNIVSGVRMVSYYGITRSTMIMHNTRVRVHGPGSLPVQARVA